MSWFTDRRREYILWKLATAGELRRADIQRTFDISESQASEDMTALQLEIPTAASYDKSAKRYVSRRHQPPARLAAIAEALGWK